ncbi:hypothetical protein DRN58_07520 [Thermococci archaeon]|nr:MAG: hypothetical protein DRN58_07520 [Thermococci archaeon]
MNRVFVKGDITRYLLHPWVYSNNIINGDAEKGDCVEVYTTNKKFLGSAIYNPDSSISLRFYSRDKEELDYLAIKKRIITALKRRRLFFGEADSFRVVFSESDMLPGLIIDKYGDGVVVQINSYGMEKRRRDVFNAILDVLNPVFLYEKSTSYARLQEKLKPREKLIFKKFEDLNLSEYIIEEDGIKIMVDIEKGQKTGYFLDQHINRRKIEKWAEGATGLDLFSYTGGFTLRMLKKMRKVYAVDISEDALNILKKNLQLNNFSSDRCLAEKKDVFVFLDEAVYYKIKFDFIVIDPPALIRKAEGKRKVINAYNRLLRNSIKLLSKGGVIAIFSCSNYIKWEGMYNILKEGTGYSGRSFVILEMMSQSPDHPVLSTFPESEYLRGFLIKEVIP